MGEAFISVQQDLQTAHSQASVGRNRQIILTRALTDDARRPALLEQQLMPAIALDHQPLQLYGAVVGGDPQVKGDLLHRPNIGERQPVVQARHNSFRACFKRESGRQDRAGPVVC